MIQYSDGGAALIILVAFAVAYFAGAAAVAFWIDARFPRLAPDDVMRAVIHLFAAAVANQLLDTPLAGAVAGSSLPQARVIAVIGVILPLVVYAILATIWVLKIAHRALSGHLR